jgi:membrane protein DedA with SNARE-associated domain
MPSFFYILKEIVIHNYFLASIFLYLSIVFLGNIASFTAFWIIIVGDNIGKVGLFAVLILTYLGDVSGDFLWFNLGKFLRGTKIGDFILKKASNHNQKFEEIISKNGFGWFKFSKFFLGSSPYIAFALGWAGADIKKFLKTSLIFTAIWVPIFFFISLGIILGLLPFGSAGFLKKIEWLFILGIVLFIIIQLIMSYLFKKILFLRFKIFNHQNSNRPRLDLDDKNTKI